jgi:hypothetical protein
MKTVWFYLCLTCGLLLAAMTIGTPAVIPASAPADAFSAARAFADIEAIAARPHPVGSADHARVRDYLVRRLNAMGLHTEIFDDTAVVQGLWNFARTAPVSDVIARLPGKNPALPTLLVMSHYDTVPHSPGAADNTAGVAVSLEIARALKAGPQPERDVLFLVTDGEELGLLGAGAFFADHPLAKHVGAVINFDARGDGGLTAMYETGPGNAGMIGLFARTAIHPSATSLAGAVYDRMPNGSDFTIAKNRGLPGLNFAFVGDELAYHSPIATPAHLDLGSVQHMGEQSLPAARALAMAAALPQADTNAVFSDLFGQVLIHYPSWAGWLVLGLAALLIAYGLAAGRRDAPLRLPTLARVVAAALLSALAPALLLYPAGRWLAGIDHLQRIPHYAFILAAALCLAAAAFAVTVHSLRSGKGRITLTVAAVLAAGLSCLGGFDLAALTMAGIFIALIWLAAIRPLEAADLWRGGLIAVFSIGLGLQIVLPVATPVIVWPLLAAAAIFAGSQGKTEGRLAALLIGGGAVLVLGWLGGFGNFLFDAMGIEMPSLIALPVLAALPILIPLAARAGEGKYLPAAGIVLLLAGAGLMAFARLAPPSAAHPSASIVVHVQNLDSGKAWRVAGLAALDPFSRAVLEAGGGKITHAPLPGITEDPVWAAPTAPAVLPRPQLAAAYEGNVLRIRATPGGDTYSLLVSVRPSVTLNGIAINGKPAKGIVAAGKWTQAIAFSPSAGGVTWTLAAPAHGRIDIRLKETHWGWPRGATPLPAMPKAYMPMYSAGTSQGVIAKTAGW